MRTTLDIADDVLRAARDRARREHKTMGEVISELARTALTSRATASSVEEPQPQYGLRPFASRGVVVTNDVIDKLREEDAY